MLDVNKIERAATIIRDGGLVAMPTETVYGLAADAMNDGAVARIFEAKGRPTFNPLIAHVAGAEMAARFVDIPPLAETLIDAFWPGPLTLVLPRRKETALSLLVSAGLETAAIRAPAHKTARALIAAVDRPLAAPSANRSGRLSPTTADHVRNGDLAPPPDFIIDGGPSAIGVESAIVKVDGDTLTLLRPGGLPREAIEDAAGAILQTPPQAEQPEAPGMLASHYAPSASLRLNATSAKNDEAFLAFGDRTDDGSQATVNLSASGDLNEAAANLFRYLHNLDERCAALAFKAIAVAPVPNHGLGEAINDRLARAAAPRE